MSRYQGSKYVAGVPRAGQPRSADLRWPNQSRRLPQSHRESTPPVRGLTPQHRNSSPPFPQGPVNSSRRLNKTKKMLKESPEYVDSLRALLRLGFTFADIVNRFQIDKNRLRAAFETLRWNIITQTSEELGNTLHYPIKDAYRTRQDDTNLPVTRAKIMSDETKSNNSAIKHVNIARPDITTSRNNHEQLREEIASSKPVNDGPIVPTITTPDGAMSAISVIEKETAVVHSPEEDTNKVTLPTETEGTAHNEGDEYTATRKGTVDHSEDNTSNISSTNIDTEEKMAIIDKIKSPEETTAVTNKEAITDKNLVDKAMDDPTAIKSLSDESQLSPKTIPSSLSQVEESAPIRTDITTSRSTEETVPFITEGTTSSTNEGTTSSTNDKIIPAVTDENIQNSLGEVIAPPKGIESSSLTEDLIRHPTNTTALPSTEDVPPLRTEETSLPSNEEAVPPLPAIEPTTLPSLEETPLPVSDMMTALSTKPVSPLFTEEKSSVASEKTDSPLHTTEATPPVVEAETSLPIKESLPMKETTLITNQIPDNTIDDGKVRQNIVDDDIEMEDGSMADLSHLEDTKTPLIIDTTNSVPENEMVTPEEISPIITNPQSMTQDEAYLGQAPDNYGYTVSITKESHQRLNDSPQLNEIPSENYVSASTQTDSSYNDIDLLRLSKKLDACPSVKSIPYNGPQDDKVILCDRTNRIGQSINKSLAELMFLVRRNHTKKLFLNPEKMAQYIQNLQKPAHAIFAFSEMLQRQYSGEKNHENQAIKTPVAKNASNNGNTTSQNQGTHQNYDKSSVSTHEDSTTAPAIMNFEKHTIQSMPTSETLISKLEDDIVKNREKHLSNDGASNDNVPRLRATREGNMITSRARRSDMQATPNITGSLSKNEFSSNPSNQIKISTELQNKLVTGNKIGDKANISQGVRKSRSTIRNRRSSGSNPPSRPDSSGSNTPKQYMSSVNNTPKPARSSGGNTPKHPKSSGNNTPRQPKSSGNNTPREPKSNSNNIPRLPRSSGNSTPKGVNKNGNNIPQALAPSRANHSNKVKTTGKNAPNKSRYNNTPSNIANGQPQNVSSMGRPQRRSKRRSANWGKIPKETQRVSKPTLPVKPSSMISKEFQNNTNVINNNNSPQNKNNGKA